MKKTAKEVLLAVSVKCEGDNAKMIDMIRRKERVTDDEITAAVNGLKSEVCTVVDDEYPDCFKQMLNPSVMFYYYGDINLLSSTHKRLTVVGGKMSTNYPINKTTQYIKDLEEHYNNSVVIVSSVTEMGSLQSTALRTAMYCGAPIIVVLPSGIDAPYKGEGNPDLFEYCRAGHGLMISEYPGKTQPKPENFVAKARILAAAGDVIFVGSGTKVGNATIVASLATECGKNIAALPCDITDNDLCDHLIADGAYAAVDWQHIADLFD